MTSRITALVFSVVSLVVVGSVQAMPVAQVTTGVVGLFTEIDSELPPVSNNDFVNGATSGGPANANGVTLALSAPGVFGSDDGVSDGAYLGGPGQISSNTDGGWGVFQSIETATYTFASPTDFYGGSIGVYTAHSTSGGDLDLLVEVDTGSGFTTLVDTGLVGVDIAENRLSIDSLFIQNLVGLRFTFDATTTTSQFTLVREIDIFTTPEPSTGLLAAFGMTGLVMRRRRKRG